MITRHTCSLFLLMSVLLLWVTGCKEPFDPEVKNSGVDLLVVEGFIAGGGQSTTIRLSRTVDLSSAEISLERGATVLVEDESNTRYYLSEISPGNYSATLTALRVGVKYRLHIMTRGQKEYISDYSVLKASPAIDSLPWQVAEDGVVIGVSTHDDNDATRYYRWKYDETWEFRSVAMAQLDWKDGTGLIDRPNFWDIYTCWQSSGSTAILIGSTAGLSKDVVTNFRMQRVPRRSEKLSVMYSVLVHQYALTEDEYYYWQKIRKNTEELGGVFDPQPSDIPGNIHCLTEPAEFVIGYIGACVPSQKRIFISNAEVAPWGYQAGCSMFDIKDDADSLKSFFEGNRSVEPLYRFQNDKGAWRVSATEASCADCTLRGTNVKPSFWPR